MKKQYKVLVLLVILVSCLLFYRNYSKSKTDIPDLISNMLKYDYKIIEYDRQKAYSEPMDYFMIVEFDDSDIDAQVKHIENEIIHKYDHNDLEEFKDTFQLFEEHSIYKEILKGNYINGFYSLVNEQDIIAYFLLPNNQIAIFLIQY